MSQTPTTLTLFSESLSMDTYNRGYNHGVFGLSDHDPHLIDQTRRFVEKAMTPDPHQHICTLMWRLLLGRRAEEIAAALVEDSDRGQLLSDTTPVFGKLFTSREVVELLDQDRAAPS